MGKSACPVGPVSTAFAEQVQLARHRQRVSQRQLAAMLTRTGWPMLATALHKLENGERRITLDDAVAIASVLKISLPAQIAGLFEPCGTCSGRPPQGFSCTTCGAVGAS